jgi:hypothetical protein
MKIELLPEEGNLYKANMHCHTTVSDGKQTPEEVKQTYLAMGYSAVCYTDHEVLVGHKDLCDENFVALHGYEIAVKKDLDAHTGLFMPVYHFNLIAKDQNNFVMPLYFKSNPSMAGNAGKLRDAMEYSSTVDTVVYDKAWLSDYLKQIADGGYLVTYNHPQWSLQGGEDFLGMEGLHAIETMNGGCARVYQDNTSIHYEQMLRAGMRVVPVGGDDNHGSEVGLAWTMIKAPELSYGALIDSYTRGYCYASEGPDFLRLVIEDGKICIKTSPVYRITLLSEGRYFNVAQSDAADLTEAVFDYHPECYGRYFRFELRDAKGNHAYSSAFYPDEL